MPNPLGFTACFVAQMASGLGQSTEHTEGRKEDREGVKKPSHLGSAGAGKTDKTAVAEVNASIFLNHVFLLMITRH